MPEKLLPKNYEQGLEEFNTARDAYLQLQKKFDTFRSRISNANLELEEQYKYLNFLRHREAYQSAKAQGLGVCSTELISIGFNTISHNKIDKATKLEKLGLFPINRLRFVYFFNRFFYPGGYQEHTVEEELHYILTLCPHHFPKQQLSLPKPSLPHFRAVVKKNENKFIDKLTDQPVVAEFKTSLLPEKIFKYFQIPPLPDHSMR
ncbi:MAG: hypothetical protein Q7R97_04770 [Candidatus Daviesbacteria bacterium]|nr:hypothetical protein [Candidatus Daviesbacteria bacterium]